MTMLPTAPKPAMFGWQAPLYMLGGGIAAASQPGGNFAAGVQQAGQNWHAQQNDAERMGWLREQADRERQQFENEQRRANQEAEQRASLQRRIAAMFGGGGQVNTASAPQPGQPAMFGGDATPARPIGNYGAAVGGAQQPAMFGPPRKPMPGVPVDAHVGAGGIAGTADDEPMTPAGGSGLPFDLTEQQASLLMAMPYEQQVEALSQLAFAAPKDRKTTEIAGRLVDAQTGEVIRDLSAEEIALRQASRPQTNINMPGNPTPDEIGRGEFAKQNAATQAKYFDQVAQAGAQAQTRLGDINQLTALIEMTPQGAGQEYLNKGAAVLSRFGVDTSEYTNVPAAQAFQSIVSRIAPTLRVAGSGATSDFEMQQFLASLPAIANMQGGNRIIAGNLKKLSERSVQEANIAIKVQGGDLTPAQGRKAIIDLGPLNLDLPKFSGAPVGGPGGAPSPTGGSGSGIRRVDQLPEGFQ